MNNSAAAACTLNLREIAENLQEKLAAVYIGDPQDWLAGMKTCSSLGIHVISIVDATGSPGEYVRSDTGTIILNLWHTEEIRAATLEHEIAHHLLWEGASHCYEEENGLWGKTYPLQPGVDAQVIRHILCQWAARRTPEEEAEGHAIEPVHQIKKMKIYISSRDKAEAFLNLQCPSCSKKYRAVLYRYEWENARINGVLVELKCCEFVRLGEVVGL